MRPERFQQFALDAYAQASGIGQAEPWSDGTKRPLGIKVRFASGAEIWHGITAQPRDGDRYDEPEQPVEKQAPDPLPLPDLGGGRIRITDAELYVAAVLNNTGSPEIARCYGYSHGRQQAPAIPGVGVEFWSGARIFMPFVHALRSGQTPGKEYDLPQEV
ncbi:hypothetical protein [Streptomyces sp. URMC 129]|uniref:hypothetical protein n=1 Tax=Streptomyces sp. URMC 129 TaxID=3423407 RepID=UPI003F1BBE77